MPKPHLKPLSAFVFTLLLFYASGQCIFAQQPGTVTFSLEQTEAAKKRQIVQAAAEQARAHLLRNYEEKANLLVNHYVKAQQAFYHGASEDALKEINSALLLSENADLLAFKGAIYYGMGKYGDALIAFSRAFKIDSELPVPRVQGLQRWLSDKQLIN